MNKILLLHREKYKVKEPLFKKVCSGHCQVDMGKPSAGNIDLG
jgi:hypothetical protein